MKKRKTDIGIGYRAAAEINRLFPKKNHAAVAMGCSTDEIKAWGHGVAPVPTDLARLHELGADVIWILTGKREGK